MATIFVCTIRTSVLLGKGINKGIYKSKKRVEFEEELVSHQSMETGVTNINSHEG